MGNWGYFTPLRWNYNPTFFFQQTGTCPVAAIRKVTTDVLGSCLELLEVEVLIWFSFCDLSLSLD